MNASTFNGGEDNPRPATPVPTARADFREGAKITVNKEDQHVREEKRRTPARPQPRRSRPAGVSEVYGLGRDGGLCVMKGGVLNSYSLSRISETSTADMMGELSFVQISDSHMGFNKPANPDVAGSLKAAVDKINALSRAPEFMLHTGDISHLSKPEEFDTVDQILKSATPKDVFYVPGEHDVLNDDGKQFLERYGKGSKGGGWYSFDKKG